MSRRIKLIDVAKGISIILVAIGHTKLRSYMPDIHQAMLLFRMPLFFFLSGVFFSVSTKPAAFIAKKTDALLKPYFVTLFVALVISMLSGQEVDSWKILGVVYGNGVTIGRPWAPLWFLTHLWCLYIATYFLFRHINLQSRSIAIKTLFLIFLFVVGSLCMSKFWYLPVSIANHEVELPGLPFSIDIIFLSMMYFVSGAFLSENIKKFEPTAYFSIGATCLFILIAVNTGAIINFSKRIYAEPLYATIAAFSGIYVILTASYYLCKSERLTRGFVFFGEASLFILIFHAFISFHAFKILIELMGSSYKLTCALLAFIASIVVPVFIRKMMLCNPVLMLLYFPLNSRNIPKKCS